MMPPNQIVATVTLAILLILGLAGLMGYGWPSHAAKRLSKRLTTMLVFASPFFAMGVILSLLQIFVYHDFSIFNVAFAIILIPLTLGLAAVGCVVAVNLAYGLAFGAKAVGKTRIGSSKKRSRSNSAGKARKRNKKK